VEMGEHYRGDVRELCNIVQPDYAVVTGINEAHLERMKTMENLTATIFEIVSAAKPGAMVVLNGDDKKVMENYKKFALPDQTIKIFKVDDAIARNFKEEKLIWEGGIEGLGKIEINLLGEYALGMVSVAIKIARSLGMGSEDIKKGIAKIKPVEHRLQPLQSSGGILVIDDSYNGNSDGAEEAIKVLSRFEGRRKLYITPGLVEMGKSAEDIHRKIGTLLAATADVVILVKNSMTAYIEDGIKLANKQIGKSAVEIIWFNTAPEAHHGLKEILKSGDVILFQNDWGDNYV